MFSYNLAFWLEGAKVSYRTKSFRVSLLKGLFIAALLAANILSGQMMVLFGDKMFTTGTLAYVITFIVTDTLAEVLGKEHASRLIWSGAGAQALFLGLIYLGALVASPDPTVASNAAYWVLTAGMGRYILASLVAYLISQHLDITLFLFWKKATRGKWLWLRNNASTILSQLVDTTLYVTIAYIGNLSWNSLLAMLAIQWIVKVLLSLADTPIVYFLVLFVRRGTDSYRTHSRTTHHYK